ncbi:MAG TPA: DUF6126 family protein [Streptomyces sp.]|nr:DUF6126 family protein [Streptomyces sp.]
MAREDTGVERGNGRFPRGLTLRLFFYVIASHLLGAFIYLLFVLGAE